jgi:hypothetical protein
MSVSASLSYVAYLRDVARSANASIAPSVVAKGRAPRRSRIGTTTIAEGADADDWYDDESVESSFAYDYLREPPPGVLRGRSAHSQRRQQCKTVTVLSLSSSNARLTEECVKKATGASASSSSPSNVSATAVREDPLKVSFEHLYATLKEVGCRELEAVAAARQTTHRRYPTSPSRATHPAPSSRTRSGADGNGRQAGLPQATRRASRRAPPSSSPACFRHSWAGSSLAIRVPPMLAEDDVGPTAAQVGKMIGSTDTSAITSSPTKLTSSSSSSAETSVCWAPGAPTDATQKLQQKQHHHHRTPPRQSVGFSCPRCCRRCDSCQCVGRPCQRSGSKSSSRNTSARQHAVSAALVPARTARCVTPTSAYVRVSPTVRRHSSSHSPLSSHKDTVRLQWPNQPEGNASRLVPSHSSSRAASPTLQPSVRNIKRSKNNQHRAHTPRHHKRSSKAGAERAKKEAVLRDVAQRACTCYWSDFPDLTMAINPSSHAAVCPYQTHHALYDELMASMEDDFSEAAGDVHDALSSVSSGSSSASSYSVKSSAPPAKSSALLPSRRNMESKSSRVTSAAVRDAVGKALTHHEELQQLYEQRRRWLAEEEATAKKVRQGRAAVMGSTKRRTYMEQIIDAARDAPSPTKTATVSQRTAAAAASAATKPLARRQQHTDAPSPSATSVVDAKAVPPTIATEAAAAAPAPPPLLPPEGLAVGDAKPPPEHDHDAHSTPVPAEEEGEEPSPSPAGQPERVEEEEVEQRNDDNHDEVSAVLPTATPVVEEPVESQEDNDKDTFRALSRPRQRPAVGVPGPGAYHVDVAYVWSSVAHGVRGVAMPKATRMPPIKSITPGPGTYNIYGDHNAGGEGDVDKKKNSPSFPAGTDVERTAADGGDGVTEAAAEAAASPNVIGSGVVFSSTGARQFQLQFGTPYQRDSTWAKQLAALPGPGAYSIVDGDRFDQSRPPGTAKLGFRFAKSIDGAHFTGIALSSVAPTTATAAQTTAAAVEGAVAPSDKPKRNTVATAQAVTAVVPWRDWAGGAYIGTSTTAFWAHPSLAGGGRRTLPRRGDTAAEQIGDADALLSSRSGRSAGASAAAAAAAKESRGGVWHGVGSGVALRLTSQRFPMQSPSPNPPSPAPADETAVTNTEGNGGAEAAMARLRRSRGEPGPASYETEAALKFVWRRAPEVSMTFRHDRGPRGPLQSTAAAGDRSDTDTTAGVTLPGPGSYDVVMSDVWGLRRSPQWSFGTAPRLPKASTPSHLGDLYEPTNDDDAQTPGPGAYNTEAALRAVQPASASAVMSGAPRFAEEVSGRDIEVSGTGAAASMLVERGVGGRVGPGTYDLGTACDALLGRVRGGVLPRATRRGFGASSGTAGAQGGADSELNGGGDDDKASPGPGTYTLPPLPATGPIAYLGTTAPRFLWEREVLGKARSDSANAADCGSMLEFTPGPGAYDVAAAAARLANRPGAVIGLAPRTSFLVPATGSGSTSGEVGPGSYDVPSLPAGRSAVMSCAGGAQLMDTDGPGPGLYDPTDPRAPAPRGFSLARTSARFTTATTTSAMGLLTSEPSRADAPGPGAYDVGVDGGVAASPLGGAALFGTARRFSNVNGSSPSEACGGPGMEGSHVSVVGPGSYDPYLADTTTPAYSFPRGPRFAFGDGTANNVGVRDNGTGGNGGVGPGAYEVVDLSPPTRSAVMGSAVARPLFPNGGGNGDDTADVPGPGAYDPQYTLTQKATPQVILSRAADGSHYTNVSTREGSGLGPGQYDPQYPADNTQGCIFGLAPRGIQSAAGTSGAGGGEGRGGDDVPGPGAYEVRVTRDGQPLESGVGGGPSCLFGTAPRYVGAGTPNGFPSPPGTAADVPGPGAYIPEVYTDIGTRHAAAAASVSIGAARRGLDTNQELRRMDNVPGPGAYTPEAFTDISGRVLLPGSAASRIGTAPRTFVGDEEAKAAVGPGPGAYEPNLFAGMTAEPSITFPRADPRPGYAGVPGVAAADTPGPGAYSPTMNSGGVGVAGERAAHFGSAPRFPPPLATSATLHGGAATPSSPAPNAYSPVDAAVQPAIPAFRFGTAAAHDDGSSYHRTEASLPSPIACAAGEAVPGPGAYDVDRADRWLRKGTGGDAATTTPAYRFGTAARFTADNGEGPTAVEGGDGSGVGPGAYDVTSGYARSSQLPTAAAYSFPRAPAHASAVQGESSYGDGEAAAAAEGVPGPGAYSLDAGYRATLPRAAVVNFASSGGGGGPRSEYAAGDGDVYRSGSAGVPGPGAYQLPPAFPEGPQWGFGTAQKHSDTNSTNAAVGPGSYAVPPPPPLHSGVTVPRASTNGALDRNANTAFPGPGSYDVTEAYVRSALSAAAGGVRIGTAPRYPADAVIDAGTAGEAAARCGPGPGAYSPNLTASSQAAGTATAGPTFTQAARLPPHGADTADTVGPGSYDIPSFMSAAAAPRFGTAPRMPPLTGGGCASQTGQDVGPGSYVTDGADGHVLPRAPAYSIAVSRISGGLYTAAEEGQPGPGSYDVPVAVQSHARAALLLGRGADAVDLAARQQTPGPGAYDPQQLTTGSRATSAAHRFNTAPTHRLPSPPSLAFTMDSVGAPYCGREEGSGPGPGAYDSAAAFLATQTRGPSAGITMAGRPVDREAERRSAGPGPGAYNITLAGQNGTAPAFSFGTALRMPAVGGGDGAAAAAVGPGAYEVGAGQRAGQSISFTQAPRMTDPGSDSLGDALPGPGAYDLSNDVRGASPSFTIPRGQRPVLRCGDADASPLVGPGSYTPVEDFSTAAAGRSGGGGRSGSATTIAQAPRVWSVGNADTPGPGSYDLPTQAVGAATVGGAVSFGTSQRPDPAAGRRDTPGPGTYDPTAASTTAAGRLSGPTFGTAGRPDTMLNTNPGPGTYEQSFATPPRGACVTFGSAARPEPGLHNTNPGPGTYEPTAASLLSSSYAGGRGNGGGGPSFGSATRPSAVLNDNPGPGTYDGMYGSDLMASALRVGAGGPSTTFPLAGRPSPVTNDNPGPGTYQTTTTTASSIPAGPAPSFGFGERPDPVVSTNPGPGAYYRESYIARLTNPPGFRFGQAERTSPVLNSSNPGPGTYYRDAPPPTYPPTFAFAGRPSAVLNTNPGPGTYYKDDYLTTGRRWGAGMEAASGVGFGKAQRPSPVLNSHPGPGAYHTDNGPTGATAASSSGSEFGRAARLASTRNDTPGPGAYFRSGAEYGVSTAPRGVAFSTNERPDPTLNENPGPGAYFRGTAAELMSPAPSPTAAPAARCGSAPRKRVKRPTAAETLRKLADVGYPLDKKADISEGARTAA